MEYTFDAQGRMKTMKTWQDFVGNAGAATTTWHYDSARGWLTNKTYHGGLGTTYTNTPAGRLQSRGWARGVTTTYGYNAEGDLAAVDYSDGTPDFTYGYDSLGRQIAVTNGSVVCLRSNNLAGTLLSEKWLGGTLDGWWVTNHFDSLQRRDILQVFSGSTLNMQHAYAYDSASRLTQVSQGNYTVGYTYLPNSPLVGQVGFTNNGTGVLTTTKHYDFLNRLTTIASVGTGATPSPISFAYRYNAANQRVQANREDGAYWRYEYDKLGQVTSGKKFWSDGTPIPGMQFEYGFDDIGNRKSTVAGGNQSGAGLRPASYGANLLNQYTNRTVPGGFDVLGAASATNSVTVNASPADYRHGEFFQELITTNNTNAAIWQTVRVTNTASGAYETGAVFLAQSPESFTHDADGNLTQDGHWDYTWDGENRLIAMEARAAAYNAGAPRQKLLFGYDWQGRRISKTVSNYVSGAWSRTTDQRFVYDGWNLLAILNSPSAIAQQFMWGLDLSGSPQGAGGVGGLVKIYDNVNDKHYFPAYDGNGNVVALADGSNGAEAARYEYGPFGEPLVVAGSYAQSSPFRFSTKFTDDETGVLYYGYRSYNPLTGEWLSRDPIGERGGMNLCNFLGNDPLRRIDPDGRWWWILIPFIVGGCSQSSSCYCCCVDDITTDPNPPKAQFRPESGLRSGSYTFPFDVVVQLKYNHASGVKDRNCKLQWFETWFAGTPWFDPTGKPGTRYDMTKDVKDRFKPSGTCGDAPTVKIYDAPGASVISSSIGSSQNTSFVMDLQIEVLVVSAGDPKCKTVCKSQQKKLTVRVKARLNAGRPDYTYEDATARTE